METWISRWRSGWWLAGAGLVAAVLGTVSVVGVLETGDAPMSERLQDVALLVLAAAVILIGLVTRTRARRFGSTLIAVGSLPSAAAIALFWHPGFVSVGLLSLAVITAAVSDAKSEVSDPARI